MDILTELNKIVADYRGEGSLKPGDSFSDLHRCRPPLPSHHSYRDSR